MRIAGYPFGILVLAALAAAGGIWAMAAVAGLRPLDVYTVGTITLPPEFPRIVSVVWGAMLLLASALLLARHRWGWTLLMLATGLGLLGALWQWWIGDLETVRMLLLVGTAFYLNARDVREIALGTPERVAAVPLATPGDDPR